MKHLLHKNIFAPFAQPTSVIAPLERILLDTILSRLPVAALKATTTLFFLQLLCLSSLYAGKTPVTSAFNMRPQSLNGPRKVAGELPGQNTHVHCPDIEINEWPNYDAALLGTFPCNLGKTGIESFVTITPAHQKSFNPLAIARSLFGDDLYGNTTCSTIKIQGSKLVDRDPRAWLADYFYLSENFDGSLSFSPTIASTIIDFNAYIGLDLLLHGLYCRVYAPYVSTEWHLNMQEHTVAQTDGLVSPGRFSPARITQENLFSHASDFFAGATPPVFSQPGAIGSDPNAEYTIVRNPLTAHTISNNNCRTNAHGFGQFRAELGYDLWQCPGSHLGAYLAAAAPNGTQSKARSLFSPVIGNGNHPEVGVGFTGHWIFCASADENQQLGIYADALVTHLCSAQEERVYDLKNKPMSRYMLAAKHKPIVDGGANLLQGVTNYTIPSSIGSGIPANYQFDSIFTPVANLTAQKVKSSVGAQVDATVWLAYTGDGVSVECGYNLWLQTAEKIQCGNKCGPALRVEQNTWTLHGDGLVFEYFPNFITTEPNSPFSQKALAISASESEATINKGTNEGLPVFISPPPPVNIDTGEQNFGVDNALFSVASTTTTPSADSALTNFNYRAQTYRTASPNPFIFQSKLSIDPVFLAETDINIKPGTKNISHTFFSAIGYTWQRAFIAPYLGIGGQVEVGGQQECGGQSTLSQWGVWGKIGILFN
ncbi:MAG: hypothetical protein NT124_00560 [Candidatus Dependentiae bacterium]|nr:hypothetical protein [Candidatus Dependentiae bacterium]